MKKYTILASCAFLIASINPAYASVTESCVIAGNTFKQLESKAISANPKIEWKSSSCTAEIIFPRPHMDAYIISIMMNGADYAYCSYTLLEGTRCSV